MAAGRAFAMPAAVFVSASRKDTGADAHRVFVYGTLKRGFYNHRLLEKSAARFEGDAFTKRPMRLVLGEYGVPYLMGDFDDSTKTSTRVPGELWVVDDAGLDALDVLEGVRVGFYERVPIEVVSSPGDDDGACVAFGYVAGKESIARGIGDESSRFCEDIAAYDLATHERTYVPKRDRPATSLGAHMGEEN